MKEKKGKFEKRYWLFSYPGFYPKGGLEDIIFTSDILEECYEQVRNYYNGYLFDTETRQKIKASKNDNPTI